MFVSQKTYLVMHKVNRCRHLWWNNYGHVLEYASMLHGKDRRLVLVIFQVFDQTNA